jgi:hypothetical protein
MQSFTRKALAFSLLLLLLVVGSCASGSADSPGFDDRFNALVQPYSFNLAAWESRTLYQDIKQRLVNPLPASELNSQSVLSYFSIQNQISSLKSRINGIQNGSSAGDLSASDLELKTLEARAASLKPVAEQTIARQISQVLVSEGICHSILDSRFVFPPVDFTLQDPLYVLIVSPRDKIVRMKEITISQDINPEQTQSLESSVDSLNVSSLVVEIGGLGATYPAFVLKNDNLKWTIDTAVHEWLHQYLAFRPLGFRYVLHLLGINRSDIIPTLNETVAGIAAGELGNLVYDNFYAPLMDSAPPSETNPPAAGFDFNAAMREIRLQVDAYLAQGQVEQAEQYMEEQRQYLITQGYYIRKLNQAYFAFNGSYADSPASVDPIGEELKSLRKFTGSIKEFLGAAADLTDALSLQKALNQFQKK